LTPRSDAPAGADRHRPASSTPDPRARAAPPNERRRGWPFAVSLVLVAVLGGGALFMSGYSVGATRAARPGSSVSEADAWKPFWNVYDAITTRYPLEPVDRTKLIEGAIRGMVESVGDPYSSYLSPRTSPARSTTSRLLRGHRRRDRLGGCGRQHQRLLHLRALTATSWSSRRSMARRPRRPACCPGDVVLEVDGSTLDGLTPDEARNRVRGKAGTEVTLHIQRFAGATPLPDRADGSPVPGATQAPRQLLKEFDVTIVPRQGPAPRGDEPRPRDGTVGYVSLAGFSGEGAAQLKDAVQAHLDKGIKKIVFDLRGNPGGFVTDALNVASQFIGTARSTGPRTRRASRLEIDAVGGGVATDPASRSSS
jgi:carboxyl-terminal processing protease